MGRVSIVKFISCIHYSDFLAIQLITPSFSTRLRFNMNRNSNKFGYGGVIYGEVKSGVVLYFSSIIGNHSGKDGGAMYTKGEIEIRSSDIINNVADGGRGGALFAAGPTVKVMNCLFSENRAQEAGPAIFLKSSIYIGTGNDGCANTALTGECNGVYDLGSQTCTNFESVCSAPSDCESAPVL